MCERKGAPPLARQLAVWRILAGYGTLRKRQFSDRKRRCPKGSRIDCIGPAREGLSRHLLRRLGEGGRRPLQLRDAGGGGRPTQQKRPAPGPGKGGRGA